MPGRILLKFELIRDIMGLLVACKNEEEFDPIKTGGARVVTRLFIIQLLTYVEVDMECY